MEKNNDAELQLRNLACLVPQLHARDVAASLVIAARLREEIQTYPDDQQGPLLIRLEYIVDELTRLTGG
ncbi:hypothetical protein DT603_13370 [Pseudoxanthomonas gei]|uniref:Uncharacterized protein n=1 Tax=Pseudoxanthomonas gei TaxID=1383030 RepID=A0ABX0AE07_9GAMM|nr:hypothetical protein [Pseudoxanthomonas gei]NDK39827.1 hypothetical protein [Pseudoxanthomonas gei]